MYPEDEDKDEWKAPFQWPCSYIDKEFLIARERRKQSPGIDLVPSGSFGSVSNF